MTRQWLIAVVLIGACGDKKTEPPAQITLGASARTPADALAQLPADDAIRAFWAWFAEDAAALRAEADLQRTMERVNAKLEKVNPGVIAEIAQDGANRTLVLSADGKLELFPAVQEVFARRPSVTGWTIVAFRPRGDLSSSIEMGGKKVEMSRLKFVAEKSGSKLDVVLFMPGYVENDQLKLLGYLVLDHTVGEYDMETRIGGVDFDSLSHAPREAKPLVELRPAVDAIE